MVKKDREQQPPLDSVMDEPATDEEFRRASAEAQRVIGPVLKRLAEYDACEWSHRGSR